MRRIAAALIGTGFIGPVHREALLRLGIPVVGVLGSSAARSREAAAALDVPRAYASLDELLTDDVVSAVHITAPNRQHVEMARRALAAGKHVMCEKPLAMTAAEAAPLVDLARQTRRAAAVTYNVRFYPAVAELRARIARGDLGRVLHVTGSYTQDWLLRDTDYNWRVRAEAGGELRAVADIGTHWLDLAEHVTGLPIEAVCAQLQVVHGSRVQPSGEVETFSGKAPTSGTRLPITTDDAGFALLRLRGGALGSFHVSQTTAGHKNRIQLHVAGEQASLAWMSERPDELVIGHRDRPNEVLLRDPSLLAPAARRMAQLPGGHAEGYADTFKQCFRAFYDHIESGEATGDGPAPYPDFADGHRELLLCEAIARSAREGRFVDVPAS
jgi:predicted dehydrogenase